MTELSLLLGFWAAFGLALMSPGPNFAVLLTAAARDGRPTALWLASGIAVGEAIWGLGAVLGVSALATRQPIFADLLRIGGGCYLIWLGVSALRSAWRNAPAELAAAPSARRSGFRRGLLLMLLNAKAGVFWVSLSAVLLGPAAPLPVLLAAVGGAVLLSLAWHAGLAMALTTSAVLRFYAKIRRGLEALLGVVLTALGLKLAASMP